MNTLPGLRVSELNLPAAADWSHAAAASSPAAATNPQRWLDGLAGTNDTVLTADVPPGATGLGAAEHAQRVLAALLSD